MSNQTRRIHTSFDSVSDQNYWLRLEAAGFPAAIHPAEPDLFCRQAAMPGHDQARLEKAHVAVIGCGGLGSWIALGLARLGVGHLTLLDPDSFDRTNSPRQLMFAGDLGKAKSHALAKNIVPHMTYAGIIDTAAMLAEDPLPLVGVDAVVVGVDANDARFVCSRFGLQNGVPIIFSMLSRDGLRAQVFLQRVGGPCLSCVLPNLDPDVQAPCTAASIASCLLAASHAIQMCASALMGARVPIWRETSLDGSTERALSPVLRQGCALCTIL